MVIQYISTNISQRNQDSTLSVTLPTLTANLPQVYPFKRKKALGGERWYEKISVNYNGSMRNDLTAKQNEFFKRALSKIGTTVSNMMPALRPLLTYSNISA